jgi:hypothetical protein
MERARCVDALAALRLHPWHFESLPSDQKEQALIREAAVAGWERVITSDPVCADIVPESLRSDPALARTIKSVRDAAQKAARELLIADFLKAVQRNPSITDEACSGFGLPKTEKETWMQIQKIRSRYWKKAVAQNWRKWGSMPESLRTEASVLTLLRNELGPHISKTPSIWDGLPACYREDPCLQRVYQIATRDK